MTTHDPFTKSSETRLVIDKETGMRGSKKWGKCSLHSNLKLLFLHPSHHLSSTLPHLLLLIGLDKRVCGAVTCTIIGIVIGALAINTINNLYQANSCKQYDRTSPTHPLLLPLSLTSPQVTLSSNPYLPFLIFFFLFTPLLPFLMFSNICLTPHLALFSPYFQNTRVHLKMECAGAITITSIVPLAMSPLVCPPAFRILSMTASVEKDVSLVLTNV